MAKKKQASPPATEALPDDFGSVATEPTEIVEETDAVNVRDVRVEGVTLADDSGSGYLLRKLHIRLSPKQARTLRRIWRGLDARHARTENGRHVANTADAIRWLLDRIGLAE